MINKKIEKMLNIKIPKQPKVKAPPKSPKINKVLKIDLESQTGITTKKREIKRNRK